MKVEFNISLCVRPLMKFQNTEACWYMKEHVVLACYVWRVLRQREDVVGLLSGHSGNED